MSFLHRSVLFIALSATLGMAACANLPQTPEEREKAQAVNDPFEPTNRVIFEANDFMDRNLIKPLAQGYRYVFPEFVRNRISNVLENLGEPVVFANDMFQGRADSAGTTLERFGLNSTLGVVGMWDVATGWGMPKQSGDFGQTLYSWGINEGPYIVLPFFGPSNFRDALGYGGDAAMSPWGYIAASDGNGTATRYMIASFGASGLGRREQNLEALDALKEGSLDFYAQMRSVYRQYRHKQLGMAPEDTSSLFNDSPY